MLKTPQQKTAAAPLKNNSKGTSRSRIASLPAAHVENAAAKGGCGFL
ncbi:MAG: hypothetical protein H7838_10900 [Magnetococcus sp. DMHC-8]